MSDESEPRGGSDPLPRMSLLDHLTELRVRLVKALVGFAVAFALCWMWVRPIAEFLAQPIYRFLPPGEKLVFLGVTDPFILYVKVAALAALFVASPWVAWQAWRFISPGLYKREKYWAVPFVLAASFFFVAGGAFAYLVAFPFAVEFLLGMGAAWDAQIAVDRYYRFLLYVILGLSVMFELPVVIFLLAQLGLVTPRFLIRHFRWAVLLIFVAAAFITPTPDVVNLCLFAVPTIGLYLLGVAAAAITTSFKKKR
jgi:sec-independent protein translocase protein TatC